MTTAKIKHCVSLCDEEYSFFEVYIGDEFQCSFHSKLEAEDFLCYKGFWQEDIAYEGFE